MKRVRQKNTSAELELRRALLARGLRYRIHVPILTKPRRVADVAFSGRELRERIAKLHARLTTTRSEQHLTPDHIECVVCVALALADKPNLTPAKLADLPDARVFQMPALAGSWSRCLDGIEHPYTKRIRPITFDHDIAKRRDDVVLVHLKGLPFVITEQHAWFKRLK